MIVAAVIVITILILSVLIWKVVRPSRTESENVFHLNARQREVDTGVLAMLLSAEENEYLRKSFPKEQFRRLRRKRISLARSYLRAIHSSTGQFIKAAESVNSSSDPKLVQAAHELLEIAFRVRLNVPLVQLSLMVEWLFPSLNLVATTKLERYRDMGGKIRIMLDRLQDGVPRISTG